MAPAMTGDFVKGRVSVTDLAKLDVIATTQARDNERHRSAVSRSFVCECFYSFKLHLTDASLRIADTLTGMRYLAFTKRI